VPATLNDQCGGGGLTARSVAHFTFENISRTLWIIAVLSASFQTRTQQVIAGRREDFMPAMRERIRSTHTTDGGTVLDIDKGRMFSLNSSASAIYQMMEAGLCEGKIAEELVRRFGISVDVAKRDLNDFRETLKNYALLAGGGLRAPE
jgi:hypothetical protein